MEKHKNLTKNLEKFINGHEIGKLQNINSAENN